MLKLAFFMPYMGLYNNSKMISLTRELAARGGSIDLFMLNAARYDNAPETLLHRNISIIDLGEGEIFEFNSPEVFEDFFPESALRIIDKACENNTYDYVIGVDADGMLLANYYSEKTNCPFAYLSRKLFRVGFPGEVWTNREMEVLKQYEKDIIPQADLFVIQDFQREESFFENLGIPHHPNILHFPGSVSDLPLPAETDYWHDIYGLSPYTRVMLSVGHFNKFNLKDELIQQFLDTEHKLVWVLHGTFSDELRERLKPVVETGRIFISDKIVDWRQLPVLIASADIGLCCYYEFNLNQYLAARASATIAYFAKAGIPVIVPNFSTFQEVVLQYKNGLTLPSPEKLPDAIQTVLSHYSIFATGAREAFDDLYDIRLYSEQLWDYFRDVKNQQFLGLEPHAATTEVDPNRYSVSELLKGIPCP